MFFLVTYWMEDTLSDVLSGLNTELPVSESQNDSGMARVRETDLPADCIEITAEEAIMIQKGSLRMRRNR